MDGKPIVTTEYRMSSVHSVVRSRGDDPDPLSDVIEVLGEASDCDANVLARMHAYLLPPEWESVFDDLVAELPALDLLLPLTTDEGVLDDELLAHAGLSPASHATDGLLVLDRLEVLPFAQGMGLGGDCLRDLFRVAGRGCSLAALRAYPLQFERLPGGAPMPSPWGSVWSEMMLSEERDESFEESVRAVEGFYERAGFCVAVRGRQGGAIMVRDLPVENSTTDFDLAT
ncbi:hypothetical protein [Thioalkalivibrio sp. ALE16]|uniref:hypothetical protein n=1 Tax=Thioalkalivibrio sp. ALE16 TaxID=1158172 RepID=UPI000360B30C|nr:hypothetical protein [Thioalkalivibrio sp. ALE16]